VAYSLLGLVDLSKGQYDRAIAEGQRAVAIDPNSVFGYFCLSRIQELSGKPEEAIVTAETAMRLDPRNQDFYRLDMGIAYSVMGRYAEAVPALQRHLERSPNNLLAHAMLAVAYVELGRENEARAEAAEVLRISPQLSLEVWRQRSFLGLKDQTLTDRYLADLRKAGLK
jgi:adenylate cyclase